MHDLSQYNLNEQARLNALRDLRLLDTPPSESFDRLTRLASQLLAAPVSTISLTDQDRQWFKSKVGVDITEIPREQAPCSYAIQGDGVFVVPDLKADTRFVDSPLVQAGIRFYAGAPLFTRAGHGLGTLCVVDDKPRDITTAQAHVLRDLAGMVMSQIELQNMIGRVDPTTGAANQHQLFEDLEDLAKEGAAQAAAILIELMPPAQAEHMSRVLGSEQADSFMHGVISSLQRVAGNRTRLYQVAPVRCVLLHAEVPLEGSRASLERLKSALREPVSIDNVPITPEPSFAVYEFDPNDVRPRDVLRRLLLANTEATENETRVAFYQPVQDSVSKRRFALLNDFKTALGVENQLSLVYQPRIDLASGHMVGVEALLRWTHPTLGPISPGEFVPLIEQTAMARPMTEWVVRTALRQTSRWQRQGIELSVSINASALNLDEPDFAERVLAIAQELKVPARLIEIEFTESAIARDTTRVVQHLAQLRAAGVNTAIDDFGTGYSNLSYIQRLPIGVLKIDQSFVRDLGDTAKDRTLVKTMITMAHDLGYRVVAEGIENEKAYELLRYWGCDEGQGYLMSRPVAPAAILELARGKLAS